MKWRKETQSYMWAHYYSEDGNWKAQDEDVLVKKEGSPKRYYDSETKKWKHEDLYKHVWYLKNLKIGEKVDKEFKTLKAAKAYAEAN